MKRFLILLAALIAWPVLALDDIALPPGGDFYGVGGTATQRFPGPVVAASSITAGGAVTAGGAIDGVPVEASVPVTSVATDVDSYAQVVKKVVTVLPTVVVLEDAKADGNGVKILDVQEGTFILLSAVADLTISHPEGAFNASANDLMYASLGTAAASDGDADLTSTEADVIPKTTIDTASSTVLTNDFHAVLATAAIFNGAATPKDVFVNFSVADACSATAVTNTVSGTVTLYLLHAGDY